MVQDRTNSANETYDEDQEFYNHTLVVDDESSNHSPLVLTHDEIYNTLCKSNPRKAPGPDTIPNWILREYSVFHAKPITSILNSSYQDKEIPSNWNYANVTPLTKEKPVTNINIKRLRPIPLTPTMSKVGEEFVVPSSNLKDNRS